MKKMIEKFQKSLAVLTVGALLAGASAAVASAAARSPKDPDGRGTIAIEYIGGKVCRLSGSTTAAACSVAGSSGMVYGVYVSGTAAVVGKGGMVFDSASAAGITSFDPSNSFVSSYAISPFIMGTRYFTGQGFNDPKWEPPVPARYESGFIMKLDDISLNLMAIVRPDTGVNP